MDNGKFDEAYGKLNAAQKKAVDTVEGPVMVIAGPGTGKTQILTLRIANILRKTDTKPENILALTFTESGATAMRDRLRSYIGSDAYRVPIYTFHGFAERLIGQYPDAYMRIIGGRAASDIEKIARIETILETGNIRHLRPMGDPSYYVMHILKMISTLKREHVTPDGLREITVFQEKELLNTEKLHAKGAHKGKVRGEYQKKEKTLEKNRELLAVYMQYEALLHEDRLYDFDDMIAETIVALEQNEDMLRDQQEQYQYILADEHQDVNGSQNRILELLASYHERPNIFVVGDEKQAIYRFQGASLENFLYFEDVFKGAETISLVDNYRSGQRILDAAHSLIALDEGPTAKLRVPLLSAHEMPSSVEKRSFSHQLIEDAWVIDEIKKKITGGTELEEIAIIVRTNKEVELYASLLRKEGIAVSASADSDILRHPITISIQALLDAIVETHNEEALFIVLHGSYWGISQSDIVRVLSARSFSVPLWSIISDPQKLQELGIEDIEHVMHVAAVLKEASKRSLVEAPHRVLEYVMQESGLLAEIMAYDPLESGRVVRRLYDELEEMALRDDALSLLQIKKAFTLRMQYGLPLNAPFISTHTHAVQVMTVHKSKGLEFEVVFIPHLTDTVWGAGQRRTYFDIPITKHIDPTVIDDIDDERRLLYVGLTRAKVSVHISYAATNQDGREFIPSRLLEEIDEAHVEHIATESIEAAFDVTKTLTKRHEPITIDASLLEKLLSERGISATGLNNYLRSPWDYLYRNVLRIPEVQSSAMQFGTVLHNVMEKVTAFHSREGKLPGDTLIKEYLERELGRMPFTKEEYVRMHEKGFEALLTYIGYIAPSLPRATKEEFTIRVSLPTGIDTFPELLLTGKLDRLDLDGLGNVVRIIDYKSGKPRSRNEIEGNTKNSDGDYKRQLTFYALLLSLYDDPRYVCTTSLLTFIEADTKGTIHEELFTITEDEIEDLKQQLIEVTKEIISGDFLKTPCDEATSSYCHLARMLFTSE